MAAPASSFTAFLRRNLFASLCTAGSLALAGASVWLWQRSNDLETLNQQRTIEGEETLALLGSGPRLREQHARAAAAAQRIDDHLVTETNLGDNLNIFYLYEKESGAQLSGLRQLNSPPREDGTAYRTVPFSFTLTGSFEQVARFLFRLETGPQITRVVILTVQRRDADSGLVSANLTVNLLGRP